MDFEIVTDSSSNLVEEMIDDFGLHILPLTFMVDGEAVPELPQRRAHRPQAVLHHDARGQGDHHLAAEPGRVRGAHARASGAGPRRAVPRLLERPFRHVRGHRASDARPGAASSPSASCTRWTRWRPRAGRACSCGTPCRGRARARPSTRCATGWRPTSCTWPTGSRWTTSCSCSAAGACRSTSAWAGTMLNIKPVMHVDDEGRLIPMEKVRGRKKSLNALVDHMEKTARAAHRRADGVHHPRRLPRGRRVRGRAGEGAASA